MNRCIFIKNNKECRVKTKNNNLFCCKSHEPFNNEIVNDGCFICTDKIEKSNEILYFKCNHAVHKPCYNKWLDYSTYNEPICIICRKITYSNTNKENKKYKIIEDVSRIKNIYSILHK